MEKESASKKLVRLTHLHQQNKFHKRIPTLINPEHLTVIYLYNNEIQKIEGLSGAINVTSLYLQNNQIKIIENLNTLKKLKKLFLGHNQISVVENLEENIHLDELHVEKQTLKKCDCVCFDPRTIYALSASLHVLNITQNNIKSIYSLMPLSAMRILHAGKNKIKEVTDILETIQYWYYLYEAYFLGNPVTKKHRYREQLIGHTIRLNMLDGKQISHMTRTFIKNFEEERKNKKEPAVNLTDVYPELPRNFPKSLQDAVSSSIVKTGLSDMKLTPYMPWKQLPKRAPAKKCTITRPKRDAMTSEDARSSFPMNL